MLTVSGKGGTGKTALSAGVTPCLAASGKRVLIIDCDVGMRGADAALGLTERAVFNWDDVCRGRASFEDSAVAHPFSENLLFLAAPVGNADFAALGELVESERENFDFIWLDGPSGIGSGAKSLAEIADKLLFVSLQEVVSVRACARARDELDPLCSRSSLVVSRVSPARGALIDDIMDEIALPLSGLVPEDARITDAMNAGVPLVGVTFDGAAAAYRNIAVRIAGGRAPLSAVKEFRTRKAFARSLYNL